MGYSETTPSEIRCFLTVRRVETPLESNASRGPPEILSRYDPTPLTVLQSFGSFASRFRHAPRWEQGVHNAAKLFREIRQRDYSGGSSQVRERTVPMNGWRRRSSALSPLSRTT